MVLVLAEAGVEAAETAGAIRIVSAMARAGALLAVAPTAAVRKAIADATPVVVRTRAAAAVSGFARERRIVEKLAALGRAGRCGERCEPEYGGKGSRRRATPGGRGRIRSSLHDFRRLSA